MDVPIELRGVPLAVLERFVQQRIRQFAHPFARRINPTISIEQVEHFARETLGALSPPDHLSQIPSNLRLVLRHDCQSSGCGDSSCHLCQYNPSRICKRNLKQKYLIDDHLRAKCTASLRVEVVNEHGQCVEAGLPMDVQLEISVLNGEKYKEVCPDNTLLSPSQLKSCIVTAPGKALLKRESGAGMTEDFRVMLPLERGKAPISDLQCTTSSEALLSGKAPTFRLLVWAVDKLGEPITSVTYVVSEQFVVATKRVKHAIKSDIPSVVDHISKLVHIGKATVDKLSDLRNSAAEDNIDLGDLPDQFNRIDKVGDMQRLVELTELNSDLKNKLRHLLKLSPEKWEEVAQHALAAVVPDFRPRFWHCPAVNGGLLFHCKNGSVVMEQPTHFVKRVDQPDEEVVQLHQLEQHYFSMIPKLKHSAETSWYQPGHPGWRIWTKGADEKGGPLPGISPSYGRGHHISPFSQPAAYRSSSGHQPTRHSSPGNTPLHPNAVQTAAPFGQHPTHMPPASAAPAAPAGLLPGIPPQQPILPPSLFMQPGPPPPQQQQQQQRDVGQKSSSGGLQQQSSDQPPAKTAKVSPFANPLTQIDITATGGMANWGMQQQGATHGQSNGTVAQVNGAANGQSNTTQGQQQQAQQQGGPMATGQGHMATGQGALANGAPSLAMLKTEDLPGLPITASMAGMDRGASGLLFANLTSLPSLTDMQRSNSLNGTSALNLFSELPSVPLMDGPGLPSLGLMPSDRAQPDMSLKLPMGMTMENLEGLQQHQHQHQQLQQHGQEQGQRQQGGGAQQQQAGGGS